MSEFRVSPVTQPLRGGIRVPADKSISHRAAILGALATGTTRISNFLQSETTQATVNCLRALGVEIEQPDATTLIAHGRGLHSLREPSDVLHCSGSGTTMRLLAGVCAGQDFLSILDGTPALKRRPMARIAEPLRAMGATVLGRDDGRLPPLGIRGGNLHGIDYTLPVASAQVKSAILLAGLFADSPTIVREPALSRDHTERMLRAFGAKIEIRDWRLEIGLISNLQSPISNLHVPNDFSSAAFFIVAALLVPGSEIWIEGVGVSVTRTGLLDALRKMGARIELENERDESGEPVADVVVRGGSDLRATEISGEIVPRMIDEFPIFAIAATQARGETVVRDAQELRVKESDRIGTLATELRKMGAQIQERADGFVIAGPTKLRGARVDAHHDHRLAMSLAVAGLLARGETVVAGWECVADSFPGFATLLPQVAEPALSLPKGRRSQA
ncbi:MAG: 3-phosphoshikimate 1-carboxyvinyltransferase [Chloroflexi bacterium]|nr:3-phosphoshikimate 1-carboxyvinyltransferase [Chloroflexota bacterium]